MIAKANPEEMTPGEAAKYVRNELDMGARGVAVRQLWSVGDVKAFTEFARMQGFQIVGPIETDVVSGWSLVTVRCGPR